MIMLHTLSKYLQKLERRLYLELQCVKNNIKTKPESGHIFAGMFCRMYRLLYNFIYPSEGAIVEPNVY